MKCTEVYSILVRSLIKNALWISVQFFCVQVTHRKLLIGVVVNFYRSCVCIEVTLCLAIVSTALQKLLNVWWRTPQNWEICLLTEDWPNYTSCPQVVATQVVGVAGRGEEVVVTGWWWIFWLWQGCWSPSCGEQHREAHFLKFCFLFACLMWWF